MIYQVIVLAFLIAGVTSGFITFRIMGMKMAPHFGVLLISIIAAALNILMDGGILYIAVALQVLAGLSAYIQFIPALRDNFQAAPLYSTHLSMMTVAAILGLASLF